MKRGATLSACGLYRYSLTREWGDEARLVYVMLNPSTADAHRDDPTIRRCIGFAQSHGFGSLEVVNLYAYRTPSPVALTRAQRAGVDVVGPMNAGAIAEAFGRARAICAAWGGSQLRDVDARADAIYAAAAVTRADAPLGVGVMALGISRYGHPMHPLYLPASSRLVPFGVDEYRAATGEARNRTHRKPFQPFAG